MRYFKLSASLFVALLVVVQVVHAQSSLDRSVNKLDDLRGTFKTGYSVSVGLSELRGQVFRPSSDGTMLESYPGVELTLDAGADFSQQVVTDAKGNFVFADVPVGSYAIFAQNTETNAFGSVSIQLSKDLNKVSSMSDFSTTFEVASLKLLFTDNDLFILGSAQAKALAKPLDEVEVASQMASVTGTASGFGGDMGMFGAALGAAGLATGIAALASSGGHHGGGYGHGYDDGHRFRPRPITKGAGFRPGGF